MYLHSEYGKGEGKKGENVKDTKETEGGGRKRDSKIVRGGSRLKPWEKVGI